MFDSFSFHIPSFQLPPLVARVGGSLPQLPQTLALCAILNLAVKTKFIPKSRLVDLAGRFFRVEVEDAGFTLCFTVKNELFLPVFSKKTPHDLLFRAKLASFLQLLARQEDPDTLFFRRDLVIEGDTDLGLKLKNMFDAVDWSRFSDFAARFTCTNPFARSL